MHGGGHPARMRSPGSRQRFLHFTAGAAAVLFLLSAATAFAGGARENVPKELPPVEVRQYQGKNLSSIEDFRENSIKGPQQVDRDAYRLRIDGLAANPQELEYGEVLERESWRKVVGLNCVEGWAVNILWEGVLMRDLLALAEPLPEAVTVILHAADGYTTSFPIGWFADRDILLAYRMNDVELPPERGFPFQLVAEDKWGYKWIKWVTRIELSDDRDYRGYWESGGFSNSGNLDQYFIGE